MIFLYAFLVGGLICAIGQLVRDKFKLTPCHITAYFVIAGSILEGFNLYDKLIDFSEAGALVPITSFGHSLTHAAFAKATEVGYIGIGTGLFDKTSIGIASAIVFAFIMALIFRPKK